MVSHLRFDFDKCSSKMGSGRSFMPPCHALPCGPSFQAANSCSNVSIFAWEPPPEMTIPCFMRSRRMKRIANLVANLDSWALYLELNVPTPKQLVHNPFRPPKEWITCGINEIDTRFVSRKSLPDQLLHIVRFSYT